MKCLNDQEEFIRLLQSNKSFGALAIATDNKEIKVVNHTSALAMLFLATGLLAFSKPQLCYSLTVVA